MHLAKHMQFHGVDYIVVPKELWEAAKEELNKYWFTCTEDGESYNNEETIEVCRNMDAYDNSNEPVEIPNE